MTVAHRRAEADSLGCALSCFIQSVTKPAHHVQNANLAVCGEYYVQQYLALDLKLAGLGCIYGGWLTLNRNRR